MISCPNKKLKAWKDLVKAVGENEAMGLWNHYKGFVPESYYKSGIKTESIKPGVEELFESNPELANAVYEALGFKQTIPDTWAKQLYDKNGNNISNKIKDLLYNEVRSNPEKYIGFEHEDLKGHPSGYLVFSIDSLLEFNSNFDKEIRKLGALFSDKEDIRDINKAVARSFAIQDFLEKNNLVEKKTSRLIRPIGFNTEQELKNYIKDNGKDFLSKSDLIYTISKGKEGTSPIERLNKKEFIPSEIYFASPKLEVIKSITPQQKQQAQQLYSQYLNTIFPDSKVKDIVYHGSIYNNKQKFTKSTRVSGYYFAVTPNQALQHAERQLPNPKDANLYSILLNIKKPRIINEIIDYEDLDTQVKFTIGDEIFGYNADSIIAEKVEEYNTTYKTPESTWIEKQIIVFEPEQIHILGNKQDIEGFKEFVNNKSNNEFYQLAPIGRSNNLQYQFKVVDKIISNLNKVIKWSNTKGLDLWKKLQQDLQIPKEQIELLKESEGNTIEEKIASFVANYSYTVEINRTKQKDIGTKNIEIFKDAEYTEDESKPWVVVFEDEGEETVFNFATKEEAENVAKNYNKYNSGMPTNYHSDLTVPGGTNYTENAFETPFISPSIIPNEVHKPFNTKHNIGWFRSDEQLTGFKNKKAIPSKLFPLGFGGQEKIGGKTRRILEVQSDLFQKGRQDEVLTSSTEIPYNDKQVEDIIERYLSGEFVTEEESKIASEHINRQQTTNPKNQFLQLLNKDNNWVTFFIKSIIQDSAKKGYKKVLFPSGNTASKIEGHTTLEEFKKQKEDRIKQLEKEVEEYKSKNYYVHEYRGDGGAYKQEYFKTLEDANEFLKDKSTKYGTPIYYSKPQKNTDVVEATSKAIVNKITQLKQELERIETEGFGALQPVYKFYSIDVRNTLVKQYGEWVNTEVLKTKYGKEWKEKDLTWQELQAHVKSDTLKFITDEYGNTWNEIEIKPEFEEPILFQLLSQPEEIVYSDDDGSEPISTEVDTELNDKLKKFLAKVGIKYESVEQILTNKGLEATAVTNLFKKLVQVVENKADITTLPEETAHVLVGLMDKDSLLYKRMYNTITQYEVYNQVVNDYADTYNNDEVKLREEAIGKLIATKIIEQNNSQDSEVLNNKFADWFNKIWQRIRSLFVKSDPFVESALQILNTETEGLKKSSEDQDFYQLNNTMTEAQAKILNKIDEDQKKLVKVENDKERYYAYEGQKLGDSVTTRIDKTLDKKYPEKSEQEKAEFKPKAEFGTDSHSDLENAGRRILSGENVARVVRTNESTYKKIEEYIKEFGKQFPKGTQFRFESKVYDRRKNEPGTIDLIAVEPSGLTHVYDYKNTTFSRKEKEVYGEPALWKQQGWNLKVARYSSILRDNYNVSKFGHRRALPTEFLFKNDKISGIKLGSPTYSAKAQYLNPSPILEENILPKSDSRQDIENAEKLNKLLNQLRKLYADTEKLRSKNPTTRELIYSKLSKLRKAIKSLQLATDFGQFIDAGESELKYIKDRLKDADNKVTNEELNSFYETVNAFSNLSDSLIHLLMDDTIDKEIQESLEKLEKNAKSLKSTLMSSFKDIVYEEALKIGEDNPLAPQRKASNPYKNINQINHPLFRIFWNLVNKKNIETRKEVEKLGVKIDKAIKNLEKWAGTTGIDKYKHLIKDKNLVPLYSSEFYKQRDQAIKNKDYEWLKNNYTVKEEKLKDFLEKSEKQIKATNYTTNKSENKKRQQEAIKKLHETYNVLKYDSAYLTRKRGFLTAKEKWRSEEYKFIYKAGNEPLKEFYELFTGTIKELKEHLPVDINGNFIPEIEESLIDAIFNSGIGSITGMGPKFLESLQVKSAPGYGQVNEFTGEIERSVPIYFVTKAKDKSLDLGKSLAIFANMALNYKHMAEIEATSHTLKTILNNEDLSKEYVTSGGKLLRDESGKFKVSNVSTDTLEAFNDFMNYYLYDVKTKTEDKVITTTSVNEKGELVTTEYSMQKGLKKVLSGYSMTSLALNLVSGGANLAGGLANVAMQASRGRYFTKTDLAKSMYYLSSHNEKAYELIKYFNIMGEQKLNSKIDKLSSSKIAGNLNSDKFFVLQHSGDWAVQNSTLLSMLQGHTVENGKIVGLKKIKNGKSLFELAEFKDGQLIIPGLTEEQFDLFRTKTQRLAENILGLSTRDNVARYKLTLQGQIIGQFRNWIPRMAEERFGSLTYDYDLETLTKGKYISFVQQLINKRALPLIKELIIGYGPAHEARIVELFNEALAENPDLAGKLTLEEFREMHLSNLNAAKSELLLIGTFMALIALSKVNDDDDEEKTPLQKQMAKLWSRSLNELTFFLNPSSFIELAGSFAPIVGLLQNLSKLFTNTFEQWAGFAVSNEKWMDEAKPLKYVYRNFPITNYIDRWFTDK